MKVFIDANILVDIIDPERQTHKYSVAAFFYLLDNQVTLFTSCDLITTIYYLAARQDKDLALQKIAYFNKVLNIIEFANKEVAKACELMESKVYKDLEI